MAELIGHANNFSHEISPSISTRYEAALNGLIHSQENGISVFKGGPLDLRAHNIQNAWLTPILVADEKGYTSFHAIQLNAGQPAQSVELNFASDVSLKLQDTDSREAALLEQAITQNDGKARIILRPSIAGNIAFPVVSTPVTMSDPQTIMTRAHRAVAKLGVQDFTVIGDPTHLDKEYFKPAAEAGDYVIGQSRTVNTPYGEMQVYGVQTPDYDPWKYYEILTPHKLEEFDRKEFMTIRVDSGCDIGQCYHDGGCDCKHQLQAALERAKDQPGMIIHAPTQDGRGYGMTVKMATEGGKRGIDVGYNNGMGSMDTIKAAQELLGEKIDIRTYEGIGMLLANLGFQRVQLMTDSRVKLEALERVGLETIRIPTGTAHSNGHRAHEHVAAKHNNGHDYFGD